MIAQHRRPALIAALLTLVVATLVGCHGGVDVAVTGIPADATVSVDSLAQDIAAVPSVVYRHRGIGSAKVFGLPAAPSYTATARDVSGCIKATATVEYDGSDEVLINLRPVTGCGNVSAPPPAPIDQQPVVPSPQPQPQPTPQPQPQPQPAPDADRDGVPDAQDLCPLLAGSSSNTSRLGCPMPRTVAAQLVPMLRGGVQTAAGYDFTVSTSPQYIDYLIILPPEAASARQVSVSYTLSAKAAWAPPSDFCAKQGLSGRHLVGTGVPGTQNTCIVYGYRTGLATMTMQPGEFSVESGRPLGDAPTTIKATTAQGLVDARAQNTLRLLLTGTVLVSDLVATATVTMEW